MKEKYNRQFYNRIWKSGDIQEPQIWPLWEVTKQFKNKRALEIGPGNYPKIIVKGGYFLDISENAIAKLNAKGGRGVVGTITNMPFEKEFFDLVVAIEIIEHVKEDEKAFFEINRVLKKSGNLIFSVPLGKKDYNQFDLAVGHERRYDIKELINLLSKNNFRILKYKSPSSSSRLMNKIGNFFLLPYLAVKIKKYLESSSLPGFLINRYAKAVAFFEKKGMKKWENNMQKISQYDKNKITLYCQKL